MSPIDRAAMNRWTGHRDAEAFRTLVQRHAGTVYATCKRIVGNVTAAEDITQECFETLARTKATTQIRALGPWLHGVATKRCLVHIRSEGRRRQREAHYASEHDTQTEIQWSDIYDCIDEAIAALPDDLRDPLIAHYLYGDSHAAIARAAGIPRRTVTSRIQRGIDSIAASLKARGITVPSALLASLLAANFAEAATLPSSLTAALGKIALTHSTSTTTAATSASPLSALLSLKGAAALLFVVAAGVGLRLYPSSPAPTETPAEIPPETRVTAIAQNPPVEEEDAIPVSSDNAPSDIAAPSLVSEIVPPPGAVIEGKVTYYGRSVPDQVVVGIPYPFYPQVSTEPVFEATTDSQGNYRVEGLEPQDLTVGTSLHLALDEDRLLTKAEQEELRDQGPGRFSLSRQHIAVVGNETLRIDFALPNSPREPPLNAGSLEGIVEYDGPVLEDVSVGYGTAQRTIFTQGTVEPDGYYRIDQIPEGDYFVRIYGHGPGREDLEWFTRATIVADEITTLNIVIDRSHPGIIRGRIDGVRDSEAAFAVAFTGDVLVPSDYSETWLQEIDAPVAARMRQQPWGYELPNLPIGVYTVIAIVNSNPRHTANYTLIDHRVVTIGEDGEAIANFDFTSDDPPVIEGALLGLHPDDSAWVNVYRGEYPMPVPFRQDFTPREHLATQYHAVYRHDIQIWNLEPGTYSLWASASPTGLVVGHEKTDWTVITIPEAQEKPVGVELTPVIQTYKATIHCRVLNLKPNRPEVIAYAISGTPEVPFQATGTYWREVHQEAASADRALDSDALTLTGLDPGTYTVIAFHFPVRNTREIRDAAGISSKDFYAATLITSAKVTIRSTKEEIQLELAF